MSIAGRWASRAIFAVLALAFVTGATVLATVALYHELAAGMPRSQALAVVAVVLGLIAGICAILACRRPATGPVRLPLDDLPLAVAARDAVRRDPFGAALAAISFGIVLAVVPSSRDLLERVIRQLIQR